jgi:hypothetical protein
MERKQKPQTKRPSEREEVKLEGRYGDIGISAVNAAVRKTPNSEAGRKKKSNLGQFEAAREWEKETELKHMRGPKATPNGQSTKR